MADGVWKWVYPKVFRRSCQLSLNKFFDRSTPSMRKVDDEEKEEEKNGVFSGHYVIASSLPPERRPLVRRTLVPKYHKVEYIQRLVFSVCACRMSDISWQKFRLPTSDTLMKLATAIFRPFPHSWPYLAILAENIIYCQILLTKFIYMYKRRPKILKR